MKQSVIGGKRQFKRKASDKEVKRAVDQVNSRGSRKMDLIKKMFGKKSIDTSMIKE